MAFGRPKKAQLRLIEDGPLEYRGAQGSEKDAVLTDTTGESIELTGGERLCRCGGSTMKPYCDGTHMANGYSSARVRHVVPSARADFTAGVLTVHDVRGVCGHAGRCTSGLPEVFVRGGKPWVRPDAAAIEAVVRAVRDCPSGALAYSVDGEYFGDWGGDPAIVTDPVGPYEVAGGVELLGAEFASTVSTDHYTLCRCGGSKNKPFCDGAHWHNGFSESGGDFEGGAAAMRGPGEAEMGDHGGPVGD